jgi:hypothetical protein
MKRKHHLLKIIRIYPTSSSPSIIWENMNLMLNMKDINKILAKTHFKCKKKVKKTHIFVKTCLPVMPSLLPHVL